MPTQKGPARWAGPFSYASLAQSVEHAAVNRRVVGSSPTGGAKSGLPPIVTAGRSFPNKVSRLWAFSSVG